MPKKNNLPKIAKSVKPKIIIDKNALGMDSFMPKYNKSKTAKNSYGKKNY